MSMGGLREEEDGAYFDIEAYWADQELEAEEKREYAEELSVTGFFDLYLYCDSIEMSEAIEELFSELRTTKAAEKTHRTNLKRCINAVLSNLLFNYGDDPERHTMYHRTDGGYPKSIRYNPFQIKLRGVKAVADGLEELEYVEGAKGYKHPVYHSGKLSRLKATPAFIEMLERRTGLTPVHIQKYDSPELVILRDQKGRDIDYPETQETRYFRDQLKAYNRALDGSEISINPSYEIPAHEIHNTDKKHYHRVFNLGSFELGGRYTGPWWQTASKETRSQILIDGMPTVECDYAAQHLHILYHWAGINYFNLHGAGDDPYSAEGYDGEYRSLMKMIFLKLTGSKNRRGLNIGMGQWVAQRTKYKGIDHKSASDAFIKKHQSIINFFYDKNTSRKLQNTDSLVSQHVITELLNEGILALDIHDSFIVQREYEERLRDVMVEGFKVNGIISIPDITSNLS